MSGGIPGFFTTIMDFLQGLLEKLEDGLNWIWNWKR